MDLTLSPRHLEFRDQVRAFLDEHRHEAPKASVDLRGDSETVRAWQRLLVEQGYVGRTVPVRYGGFGAEPDLLETYVIEQEFAHAKVSLGMQNQGIGMLIPTLLEYGREDQKEALIGPTLRAEMIWCQGYSEPNAGSDLAALETSARLDGDTLVVNGQKIWTSTANEADRMFALVRTDTAAEKHAGLSYVLLDMKSPGIEVRPLKTMTGESTFNEVFFRDVRVPQENVVGALGQGWEVGTYTLRFERDLLGRPHLTETLLEGAAEVLRDTGKINDPVFRQRLMRLEARALAMKYHGLRLLTDRLGGRDSGVSRLIVKLNGCQLNFDICALALDALGERGLLSPGDPEARDRGAWQTQHMFQLGLIIGGGTAQIQKNIISEAGLGMPRERRWRLPESTSARGSSRGQSS